MALDIDYNIATQNVRAVIRSSWGRGKAYKQKVIRNIESYYVETSLDNDADQWELQIGDPNGDLLSLFNRDSEATVQLFGVGQRAKAQIPMLTGVTDEYGYSDEGTLTLSGRDMSSLATDSGVPPKKWEKIQAWDLVGKQALGLGFQRTNLSKDGGAGLIVKKVQYTDGGETYWEFWHRIYRWEKLWIWTEPDGMLVAGKLVYGNNPRYFFGEPRRGDTTAHRRMYVPVESLEVKKSTQARIGDVWVYAQSGKTGFIVTQADPTTRHWLKRPRKLMMDVNAKNPQEAKKLAWEEIFESKVGSVEYKVTIADPGFKIEQNSVCFLNLPDPGISGEFFIVGTRCEIGESGYLIEVRLREKNYALSARKPEAPVVKSTQAPNALGVKDEYPSAVDEIENIPDGWGNYYTKAATKWHGPWDYDLFLACLMGITQQETVFKNIRSNGGPGGSGIEWYKWDQVGTTASVDPQGRGRGAGGLPVDKFGRTLTQWREIFANEPGIYVGRQWAVGPMQLLSLGLKQEADHFLTPNKEDEYGGGRWHPEHNIMEGAEYFRYCLKVTVKDSGRPDDIWMGASGYYHGPAAPVPGDSYSMNVKKFVMDDPGYLELVKNARKAAQDAAKAKTKAGFDDQFPDSEGNELPDGITTNSPQSLALLTHIKTNGSHIDITHVDYELLRRVNAVGAAMSRTVLITSGYRPAGHPGDPAGAAANGGDTQWYLWERYINNGRPEKFLAANPVPGSNHMRGEAVDAEIGGNPFWKVVTPATGAIYKLHGLADGRDPVHVVRSEIEHP